MTLDNEKSSAMRLDILQHWGDREIFFPAILASRIINTMQQHGQVILTSTECRSATHSGLYTLLDQLCDYWKWDKSKIKIETTNANEYHDEYHVEFNLDRAFMFSPQLVSKLVDKRPWNHNKSYGMFLSRANVTRIRGIHNHKNFKYHDQGLVSWHHDMKQHIDLPVLKEYLEFTDQRYSEITSIEPFSDIGPILPQPLNFVQKDVDWNSVYERIGIELVFETSEHENCWTISEKIMRPILYRRPFMIIAGKNYMKQTEEFFAQDQVQHIAQGQAGMRFFKNVIPADYDELEFVDRVDRVFEILQELISSGRINTIVEDCADDIEWNYRSLEQTWKTAHFWHQAKKYYDPKSWIPGQKLIERYAK
jgi:hypothetical protein